MSDMSANEKSAPSFSEAPAVVFTQLYGLQDGQVVQFNLTVRASSPEEAIDGILHGINHAGKYSLSTVRPDTGVQAPTLASAPTTTPDNGPSAPTAPVSTQYTNTSGYADSRQKIHAVKMEILPQPDGKVTMKWFASGHQYPDITSTRAIEKAVDLLKTTGNWQPGHLGVAKTYNVRHLIEWVESPKKNKQGNPYKDIVSLLPE